MRRSQAISERRTEFLLKDLLKEKGWDCRRPPQGELLIQQEYGRYEQIAACLRVASKTGTGRGVPEAILFIRSKQAPLAVIEAKAHRKDIENAVADACHYANHLFVHDWSPLAISIAGADQDFDLRVHKRGDNAEWAPVTYGGKAINWIPAPNDLRRLADSLGRETRPSMPPMQVLAGRADEINRLLRQAQIKDEFRPAVVAAVMFALWKSGGNVRRDPEFILRDLNASCRDALAQAGKEDLVGTIRIDEANEKLRVAALRIVKILERLNVTVLTAEHDYLGQLYETFFQYTGGNTIGQYFTPRHIARMMVDVCKVTRNDVVLDPACGSGGFLVASMNRILEMERISRGQVVDIVKRKLIGFESEPITAALCVANFVLRGDGSTGVWRADAFTTDRFKPGHADVVLMNPPFPHRGTDTPVEAFIDRGLEGLRHRGRLAAIVPMSLLVKQDKGPWRASLLESNSLACVCQLPDEVFQPFASATTAFIVIDKGLPHESNSSGTIFVRLRHDGMALSKGVRAESANIPNEIQAALIAIDQRIEANGFATNALISGSSEWAPGAYIRSAPPQKDALKEAADELLRRLLSFYARYAPNVIAQRKAIANGEISMQAYQAHLSARKKEQAQRLSKQAPAGALGSMFQIYYGMKELHSRRGIDQGKTLVISPTEAYNGCYGWLEFDQALKPPFVTVAQTGSIGEAFVQLEPCAVNDDCLVLLPNPRLRISQLIVAAVCLQAEKWRFAYGRKLTPERINTVQIPSSKGVLAWIERRFSEVQSAKDDFLKLYS